MCEKIEPSAAMTPPGLIGFAAGWSVWSGRFSPSMDGGVISGLALQRPKLFSFPSKLCILCFWVFLGRVGFVHVVMQRPGFLSAVVSGRYDD